MNNIVKLSEALTELQAMPDESVDLIYTDPPFGTGNVQQIQRKVAGQLFPKMQYSDKFANYMNFLVPHLEELHRVLKPTGTLYLHLDWRWSHYAKVACDEIFGYDNFLNEIVWSYNFGGRGKDRWPMKHDTILVYVKKIGKHTFNWDNIDRIPYAAPELQYVGRTKEEAEKRIAEGQVPTDVWSMSIVGTSSKERSGYPTQKPLKLVERIIKASSNPGDHVLDPFVGSGTTAVASYKLGRQFTVFDKNEQAIGTTAKRLNELGALGSTQVIIPDSQDQNDQNSEAAS
jgi:site-specific DNA-methyltransferase (adenine-specific)